MYVPLCYNSLCNRDKEKLFLGEKMTNAQFKKEVKRITGFDIKGYNPKSNSVNTAYWNNTTCNYKVSYGLEVYFEDYKFNCSVEDCYTREDAYDQIIERLELIAKYGRSKGYDIFKGYTTIEEVEAELAEEIEEVATEEVATESKPVFTNKQIAELQSVGVLTKSGKLSSKIGVTALRKFFDDGEKLRVYKQTGFGRSTKIITDKETELIERLVKVLGYKYIYECDAPRGGKLGDYIKIGRKNTTIVNRIVESGLY